MSDVFKWLFIKSHAIQHSLSWYSLGMYWACYDTDDDPVELFRLRWWGGERWGEMSLDDCQKPRQGP